MTNISLSSSSGFSPDELWRTRKRPPIRYVQFDERERRKKPFMLPRPTGHTAYPLAQSQSQAQAQSRASIHTSQSCEVTGQCKQCLDLFTVTVYLANGNQLKAQETSRLKPVVRDGLTLLIHRPDICGGEVSLYGSIEQLASHRSTHHVI